MALSLVNNVASVNAQNNMAKTTATLSKSLERLSSGLKINRGADGPAGLVISERMRAQVSGLKTALDNTNKAVSLVQTGEGALNEINSLLTKARSLALDSANAGVNDANAFTANQSELTNILSTIDKIANTTEFNGKKLLNGQAGVTGVVTGTNNAGLSGITAGTGATSGSQTVRITTTGTGGTSIGAGGTGAAIGASGGSVVISGGGLTSGQNLTVALASGDTTSSAATKIQTALDNAAAIGGGSGKFVVAVNANNIEIRSNVLGSGAITATSDSAGTAATTGFGTGGTTGAAGANMVVTVGGAATSVSAGSSGLNNQVNFGGAEGLTFTVDVANGTTVAQGAGSDTTLTTNNQALTFQIGSNANETSKVSFDQMTSDRLGSGVAGVSADNLSLVSVTSAATAQDAIKVIDKAISDVSNLRSKIGAFQSNTLESNANNLRTTLENTTMAESTIRDTDFAQEIASFTKSQVLMQAGQTVLGNANQLPSMVASLLRG